MFNMGRRRSWRVASDCKSDTLTGLVGSNPSLPNCQSRIVVDCAGFVNRIRKDTSVRIRSLADFAPMV